MNLNLSKLKHVELEPEEASHFKDGLNLAKIAFFGTHWVGYSETHGTLYLYPKHPEAGEDLLQHLRETQEFKSWVRGLDYGNGKILNSPNAPMEVRSKN